MVSRATLKAAMGVPRGDPVPITPRHLGRDLEREEPSTPLHEARADAPLPEGASIKHVVREYQRSLIHRALDMSRGNWAEAARLLGTNRSNLHHLAKRLALK